MLIALDEKSELITADSHLCKEKNYYCPACKNSVHLKIGQVIRPHFAHYKNTACDVFSEGETEEHIQGKTQLFNWFKELGFQIEMEAYLPELKQRPDLLVTTTAGKIAVEFQCSGITIEKIAERSRGYLNAGYQVIWILGNQFNYSYQLTAFQKACLTNLHGQLVLFHYDVNVKELSYRYNFIVKQNQKMYYSLNKVKLGQALAISLKKQTYQLGPINYQVEHQKLLKKLQYPCAKTKSFLEVLYENRESVISMPKELYVTVGREWLLQNHPFEWKFHVILWLSTLPEKEILTQECLQKWVQEAEARTLIKFYDISQMTQAQKLAPFYDWLKVLISTGVLKELAAQKWLLLKHPKFYKHLEGKFQ